MVTLVAERSMVDIGTGLIRSQLSRCFHSVTMLALRRRKLSFSGHSTAAA